MTARSEAEPPRSRGFESPYDAAEDPEKAIAFYQGVVAGLAHVGLRGAKIIVMGERLRAMSEGQLKQLAVDNAWGAINILRSSGDPRLEEMASSLLEITNRISLQPFDDVGSREEASAAQELD